MTKKLETLDKFNKKRQKSWAELDDTETCPNGIMCPSCDKELHDTEPGFMVMTDPPEVTIYCPNCGYQGYRVA